MVSRDKAWEAARHTQDLPATPVEFDGIKAKTVQRPHVAFVVDELFHLFAASAAIFIPVLASIIGYGLELGQ